MKALFRTTYCPNEDHHVTGLEYHKGLGWAAPKCPFGCGRWMAWGRIDGVTAPWTAHLSCPCGAQRVVALPHL